MMADKAGTTAARTSDAMMEYFRSMPKKEKVNPYWEFSQDGHIHAKQTGELLIKEQLAPETLPLLELVRRYFRRVWESFGTEAQVLCVDGKDAGCLLDAGIPRLGDRESYPFGTYEVIPFVLPQYNTPANTVLSEKLWQSLIIGNGITPVVRIHSHHILKAYQSSTDYSSLNSNTLEMVMGEILKEGYHLACWLDKHGTDTKCKVFGITICPEPGNGWYARAGRIGSGKPLPISR